MTADLALTALAIGLAAAWLGRRAWLALRARRASRGCAGGCGCSVTKLGGRR